MMKPAVFLVSALAIAAQSQSDTIPAARQHIKFENNSAYKYTSKLTKVVELNFTMGNGHQPGKRIISMSLDRMAANYGFTVTHFASASDGSVRGTVPNFSLEDLLAGEVIVANNVSGFGDSALGKAKQDAMQRAIETEGRGYLAFHGSAENDRTGWPWFTGTLCPLQFSGHRNRAVAPVYKHLKEAKHIVMQGTFESNVSMAKVPDEIDSSGTEILSKDPVPTRMIKNEWFQFARDISRNPPYADNVTLLLKADNRAFGSDVLDERYKRIGGQIYSFLYKVGNGMTSYIPAGHENDELLDATTGFNGGTGDFDRYVAQTLFFLAGYKKEPCDNSCLGLSIVDENNHLVSYIVDPPLQLNGTAPDAPLRFHVNGIGFSSTADRSYTATVFDFRGRMLFRKSGQGLVSHAFDLAGFKPGVYFLSVRIGSGPVQTKRYALAPVSG